MGEENNQDQLTDDLKKAAGSGIKRAAKWAGDKALKSLAKSGLIAAMLPVIGFVLVVIVVAALGLGAIVGLGKGQGNDAGKRPGDPRHGG